jgi:hypothetical protein
MHFRSCFFLLSVASILAGCSAAPNSEIGAQACGQALTTEQGLSLNGMAMNGMWNNGIWNNGLAMNGLTMNALTANGLSMNGVWSNGLWTNGLFQNGLWNNGFWQNGLWANGIFQNGVTQTGELKGLALRGLTLEEAAEMSSLDKFVIEPEHLLALGLDNGVLRGGAPDGTRLSGVELQGVLVPFFVAEGKLAWLRIAAAEPHPDAPELTLYSLQTATGENPCGAGVSGLFVPGIWDESGARHASVDHHGIASDVSYSCTTGVIAKCVAWGYAPWSAGSDMHQTCTRLARADYCGNGVPHTENGTKIDVFDTRGIQSPVDAPELSFEAGWGTNGALCVSEPRYVDVDKNGSPQLPSCWAELPSCGTWDAARARGAEMGNESAHTTRQALCAP